VTTLIAEGKPGIFVVDRQLLAQRVVYGRWLFPQNYKSGDALQKAITAFLAGRCPGKGPRGAAHGDKSVARAWRILDWNCVDDAAYLQRDLDALVSHARACVQFGLPAVRAFHAVLHRWPTEQDMRAEFVLYLPNALARTYHYLRRRRELGRHRQALKTPSGREWLTEQALKILGRKYVAHMGVGGDAYLFRTEKERVASFTKRSSTTRSPA
jgi:hypothetical protein